MVCVKSRLTPAQESVYRAETEQQPEAWVHNSTEEEINFADTRVIVRDVISTLPPAQQQAIESRIFSRA